MAKQLNVELVVEGLETRRQVDYIRERAPHAIGQGWFFGRPVSADELGKVAIKPDEPTQARSASAC